MKICRRDNCYTLSGSIRHETERNCSSSTAVPSVQGDGSLSFHRLHFVFVFDYRCFSPSSMTRLIIGSLDDKSTLWSDDYVLLPSFDYQCLLISPSSFLSPCLFRCLSTFIREKNKQQDSWKTKYQFEFDSISVWFSIESSLHGFKRRWARTELHATLHGYHRRMRAPIQGFEKMPALVTLLPEVNREQVSPWFLYLTRLIYSLSKLASVARTVDGGVKADLHSSYPKGSIFVCNVPHRRLVRQRHSSTLALLDRKRNPAARRSILPMSDDTWPNSKMEKRWNWWPWIW